MEPETHFTPEMLMTPDVLAEPYAAYRQLRAQSPFLFPYLPAGLTPTMDEPVMAWALMRHADVSRALRDPQTFCSSDPPLVSLGLSPSLTLLFDDPPRHSRLRRLISHAFTTRHIEALEPWMRQVVAESLEGLGEGEAEIMERFAIPLPMLVIARLLGIPQSEYRTFREWSQAFVSTISMPHEERQRHIREMSAYFLRMAQARRAQPAEDLLTALVGAAVEGEVLEDFEILGLCIVLLIAGNETSVNLIGAMLHLLAQRPALWEQLKADRSLVSAFIEETLRYESPTQRLPRVTTCDVEVSGVRIPQGTPVIIFFGAANRDPEAFADPEAFRLDREPRNKEPRNHVAFGAGIHYCLGAPLARTEARIALDGFLDRYAALEPGAAPAIRQKGSITVRGFQRLPLTLHLPPR